MHDSGWHASSWRPCACAVTAGRLPVRLLLTLLFFPSRLHFLTIGWDGFGAVKDGVASSKTIQKKLALKALSKWLLPGAVWAREEKRAAADVLRLHAMSGDLGRTEQAEIWGTSSVICSDRPLRFPE